MQCRFVPAVITGHSLFGLRPRTETKALSEGANSVLVQS